jgi:hypothetical protein
MDGLVGRLEPVEQHWLMIVNFSSTYYSSIHPSIHEYAGALVSLIRLLSNDSLCVVSYPPSNWVWCTNGLLVQLVDSFENKPQISSFCLCAFNILYAGFSYSFFNFLIENLDKISRKVEKIFWFYNRNFLKKSQNFRSKNVNFHF